MDPGPAANVNRVVIRTEQEPQTAGEPIRSWRTRRGLSQLELSLDTNVATKHLSFVETGRSRPSRQLLVHRGRLRGATGRARSRS
jgi:hypothetical protein